MKSYDQKANTKNSENDLVEVDSIKLFGELGWETVNAYHEFQQHKSDLGREDKRDVILVERLRAALAQLNPQIPADVRELAVTKLGEDRSRMSPAAANRDVYHLLRDGVRVEFRNERQEPQTETVRVIDWQEPANNNFLLASQFWVVGESYTRRPDLIGFVNGIPLVFVELKGTHRKAKAGYDENLTDYKDTIPHLFPYNAFLIISNGIESRIGSITAAWEHFATWKKINSEGERGVISLETMLRGTCDPARLLDLVENFTLFQESGGGIIKLCGRNHQYLGVNNTIQALREIERRQGKLGVFWHTQGSGKSLSMVFFAQKVLRTVPGNWTFVVITDRQELDDQIYKTFSACGVVTEEETQANSGEHLRQLLTEDHRFVFTLVQKFQIKSKEAGQHIPFPVLSERSDVIVITDEAHRSQYKTLAQNLRTALSNAAFLAFTGTPLIDVKQGGEKDEETLRVFGDYVSIYNFRQSIEDQATVPLYYENRVPELQLINDNLDEEIFQIVDEAGLDDDQETKLAREFAREYHLLTREERLETVAADIALHFPRRGFQGKGMVVCVDKATALRMYEKVQTHWSKRIAELKARIPDVSPAKGAELQAEIAFMEETDMAVVVSQSQNEIKEMAEKGLDIKPHRKRFVDENLEKKFKDDDDPFRLVFVCAMWMTGFDVPSCSTIYLDKPMKNHTLMQTIARANRVYPGKVTGTIVDYIGIFKNLNKALAIYGDPDLTDGDEGKFPAKPKQELIDELRAAISETVDYCNKQGFELDSITRAEGFERVKLIGKAVEGILENDDSVKKYRLHAGEVSRLYKAILPDERAEEFAPLCTLIAYLARHEEIRPEPPDISGVMQQVEDVLERSIASEGYIIDKSRSQQLIDLSEIDFEALKEKLQQGNPRTVANQVRKSVEDKLQRLLQLNKFRIDYLEKFQQLIDDYNSGSKNVEQHVRDLFAFSQELHDDERQTIAEGLTEEERAVFDILTRPAMDLTEKETEQVKQMAVDLLETLKREKLVLDWRKRTNTKSAVKICIQDILEALPHAYTDDQYNNKCEETYWHIFDSYFDDGSSNYTAT